jgi:hypothetical protein
MYLLRISRNLHVIAVSAFSIKSYRTQGSSNGSSGCSDLVSWIFKCLKGPFPMTKDGMPQTFASWPIIGVLHPHIVPHYPTFISQNKVTKKNLANQGSPRLGIPSVSSVPSHGMFGQRPWYVHESPPHQKKTATHSYSIMCVLALSQFFHAISLSLSLSLALSPSLRLS